MRFSSSSHASRFVRSLSLIDAAFAGKDTPLVEMDTAVGNKETAARLLVLSERVTRR